MKPAERVAAPPEPGTPLTVQNMALKLANSAGLARWEHYLTEWLDSYIDRWKKDEELWHETTEALQAKVSTLEQALRKIENLMTHDKDWSEIETVAAIPTGIEDALPCFSTCLKCMALAALSGESRQ